MIVSTDKVIVVAIKDTSMGSEGVKIEKVYRPKNSEDYTSHLNMLHISDVTSRCCIY